MKIPESSSTLCPVNYDCEHCTEAFCVLGFTPEEAEESPLDKKFAEVFALEEDSPKQTRRKRAQAYYYQNREQILAQKKVYREANADKIKAYQEKNKEILSKNARKYYKENIEVLRERCRKYYEANKESCAARSRKYYKNNIEACRERSRKYNEAKKRGEKEK